MSLSWPLGSVSLNLGAARPLVDVFATTIFVSLDCGFGSDYMVEISGRIVNVSNA